MKSLKELREHNNLKQREVAQHIGVSDRVYSYYEKGRTLPAKYVKPLANLFGISCDELLENNTDALDWEREFGCIERTERLELPTWEQFEFDGEFSFLDKQGYEWEFYSPDDETRISLVCGYDHFEYEYSKENYTLACRKAKELFLGEKK